MDPGSTALLEDPGDGLVILSERTGAQFPALAAARARTEQRVAELHATLANESAHEDVSTCVFGSWARGELTEGSDDDWAVLVGRPFDDDDPDVRAESAAASKVLGGAQREPGSQDIFGRPFDVGELVRHVGLDADINTNLTRRMLLLLESRELHGDVRSGAVADVLARYLDQGVKAYRPPRFGSRDESDLFAVIRQIGIDFQAGLEALLFSPKLGPVTRTYGIF